MTETNAERRSFGRGKNWMPFRRPLNDHCVMNLSEPEFPSQDLIPATGLDRAMWKPGSETLFLTLPKAHSLSSTPRPMKDGSRHQSAVDASSGRPSKTRQKTQRSNRNSALDSDQDVCRTSNRTANAISESLGYLALPLPTISWSPSCFTVSAFKSDRLNRQMLKPGQCSGSNRASETGTSHDANGSFA